MFKTLMTAKGQVVIPSKFRKRHKLKKGTPFCVQEKGEELVFKPVTADYFERMAGVLETKGKLSRELLEERKKEREKKIKK